jgi:lipid-A-disaccharide synthase
MIENKKAYIIAGEVSGDFIGGVLVEALRHKNSNLVIKGIGGRYMEEREVPSLFPIKKISLWGFLEVIPHLFTVKTLINITVRDIMKEQPDVVITIDSPGFNFRVVEKLKDAGFQGKFVHIVAPTVWAYKPSRAERVAKLYDHLFTLLPFEPPYFTKYGLKTDFIGHPIFEQNFNRDISMFRNKYNIPDDAKIICITPGSREGEIRRHMKPFAGALKILKTKMNIFAVFALNKREDVELAASYLHGEVPYVAVVGDERLDAYSIADIALAKSGTNTLEIAACSTPIVVAYKINPITYLFLKSMTLVKSVCLINILLKNQIIPELIQWDCTPVKIANALGKYLLDDRISEVQILQSMNALRMIGFESSTKASVQAADIITRKYLR